MNKEKIKKEIMQNLTTTMMNGLVDSNNLDTGNLK